MIVTGNEEDKRSDMMVESDFVGCAEKTGLEAELKRFCAEEGGRVSSGSSRVVASREGRKGRQDKTRQDKRTHYLTIVFSSYRC